jgi:hypothetical protein
MLPGGSSSVTSIGSPFSKANCAEMNTNWSIASVTEPDSRRSRPL